MFFVKRGGPKRAGYKWAGSAHFNITSRILHARVHIYLEDLYMVKLSEVLTIANKKMKNHMNKI